MMPILHVHCCEYGSCYPIGGASEMPFRIIPVIERSGGRILMKANVSQILTEGGKVVGVRIDNKENSMIDIHAPIVISDAGMHNTSLDLLPEWIAEKSPAWPLMKTIRPSIGNLSVFVGLRGTPEELGLTAQNIWIYNGSDLQKIFAEGKDTPIKNLLGKAHPSIFLSSSAAKDPSWKNRYPDRSTLTILTSAAYSEFSQWSGKSTKNRGDDYISFKNAIGQNNTIDYVSVGTPVTIEHYLSTKEGGTYNMEHDLDRFQSKQSALLRPESGIEGLYFTGQDVTSCGFASCLYSSFLCSAIILKKRYRLLWELFYLHIKLYGLPEGRNDLFF